MKNFKRYQNITSKQYDKYDWQKILWRNPSDKKILPILRSIKGKTVCDVGCGTGYYTKFFLKHSNKVVGVDQNPHLLNLKIKLYKADATDFSKSLKIKVDVVFSGWMTEYLNQQELLAFFQESYKALGSNGTLITTIIANKGWGWLYINAAHYIRGISKYCYNKKTITKLAKKADFDKIQIIPLRSLMGITWAYLLIAKKQNI